MLRLAFDFIITWRETRTRPNAYTQVAASSINACTLGKRKTAGGYIWKKKNDI